MINSYNIMLTIVDMFKIMMNEYTKILDMLNSVRIILIIQVTLQN